MNARIGRRDVPQCVLLASKQMPVVRSCIIEEVEKVLKTVQIVLTFLC